MGVTIEELNGTIVIQEAIDQVAVSGTTEYVAIDNGEGIDTVAVSDPSFVAIQEAFTELVSATDENVVINEVGIQGPAGVGSDLHYEQDFTTTTFITVTHNLNKKPAVTVIDSAGTEVVGDVNHLNNNQLTVQFSAAFGGKVICN